MARKPADGIARKTFISLRLTPDELTALGRLSRALGAKSRSAAIREMLRHYQAPPTERASTERAAR